MAIELAGIQLHRVHKIATLEQAVLVHHRVPGLEGNVAQNLGRNSVRLQIEGIFYGSAAKDDLEALRKVYKQRKPVDFLAELVGQAYFSQVSLERFEVAQSAHYPDEFSYSLTIAEYVAPPKSDTAAAASVDRAIQLKAQNFMAVATLPNALGSIPELTNPVAPVQGALEQITGATQGLPSVTEGLNALLNQSVEVGEAPNLLPDVGVIPDAPLKWRKIPSTKELLQAGASIEDLLRAGASIEDLLQAGVSATDLLQAGIPSESLPAKAQTAWLAFALVDEQGNPIAREAYRVTLPNGTVVGEGQLDERGQARLEGMVSGSYTLSFPNLDAQDWDVATTPPPELPPIEQATDWIAFVLTDEQGNPVAGERYQVRLPDGTVREGQLDTQGQARLEGMVSGSYALSFPNLDAHDWELATTPPPEPPPIEQATDWVAFALTDEQGNPVAGERYQVRLPNGTVREGQLDTQGQARLEGMASGSYALSFPNLDADDWELATTAPPELPPIEQATDWVAFALTDEQGNPVAGERYQVTLPNGTVQQGQLDTQGQAKIEGIEAGNCLISFPDLDTNDWDWN